MKAMYLAVIGFYLHNVESFHLAQLVNDNEKLAMDGMENSGIFKTMKR
jgi:hypothetical protein